MKWAILTPGNGGDCFRMVGTDLLSIFSVLAKPARYWPAFKKQSSVKWLAHTYSIFGAVLGISPSKMKVIHWIHRSSGAGGWKRLMCSSWQPTTEQLACLARIFGMSERGEGLAAARECRRDFGRNSTLLGEGVGA